MNSTRAYLARLLARAAELRAGGNSWEQVAATLGRSAATCRRWPQKYPDIWRRAYVSAARDRIAEGGAEGLLVLREMLRSKDEKIRQTAARTLAGLSGRPVDDRRGQGGSDPWFEIGGNLTDDNFLELLDSVRNGVAACW